MLRVVLHQPVLRLGVLTTVCCHGMSNRLSARSGQFIFFLLQVPLNSKSPSAVRIIKHGNAHTLGSRVHISSVSAHVDASEVGVGSSMQTEVTVTLL